MKLIKKLRDVYKNETDALRGKAVTLFLINAILGIFFLLFAMIRITGGSIVVGMGEISIAIILVLNIFSLFSGRYRLSSMVSLFLFTMAAFVMFILQDHNELDDLYKFSTYIISVICVAPLLSYTIWQMIAVGCAGVIGQVVFFYLKFSPIARANGETDITGQFVISITFLLMAAFFAVLVFRSQLSSIRMAETEKESAEISFKKINNVIDEMRGSFDLGEKLLVAAETASRSAGDISDKLNNIGIIVSNLEGSTEISGKANAQIMESEKTVKEKMNLQTEAINQSSAAVEQIVDQISFVSRLAEQKLGQIEGLNKVTRQGEAKLEDSLNSLTRLSESTDDILEIIEVIESISSRTNMLAMNAAIEAAHSRGSRSRFCRCC